MNLLKQIWIDCQECALASIEWLARKRRNNDALPAHLITGLDGETAAFFYLRRNGYTMVARRWASGELPGDIDLIAWQGPMLCFIEVKTRTARDITPAEVAVDDHKRKVLRRLAHQYVHQLPQNSAPPVRFDVLSVYLIPGEKKEFVHFEGSFGWSEGSNYESR
jgi:putative endonuclease